MVKSQHNRINYPEYFFEFLPMGTCNRKYLYIFKLLYSVRVRFMRFRVHVQWRDAFSRRCCYCDDLYVVCSSSSSSSRRYCAAETTAVSGRWKTSASMLRQFHSLRRYRYLRWRPSGTFDIFRCFNGNRPLCAFLPPLRRCCFRRGLSECLREKYLKKLWTDFDEIFLRFGVWPRQQSFSFWCAVRIKIQIQGSLILVTIRIQEF